MRTFSTFFSCSRFFDFSITVDGLYSCIHGRGLLGGLCVVVRARWVGEHLEFEADVDRTRASVCPSQKIGAGLVDSDLVRDDLAELDDLRLDRCKLVRLLLVVKIIVGHVHEFKPGELALDDLGRPTERHGAGRKSKV